MPTQTNSMRMESFPFDSMADGYDTDGYPVYDRAVDSMLLRSVFEKFFSNGVFPSPANALQVGKAPAGLAVTIQPGTAIINGAMGGVKGEDPITLTLDTSAPQGDVCYGIMLHFDLRDEYRSMYFTAVRGDASSNPQPPAPDQTTPSVYELRLASVVVPSGAVNLANATITNEKGTSVCPFAAPFMEIDAESVVLDFRAQAQEALQGFDGDLNMYRYNAQQLVQNLINNINTYQRLLDSALDETTAGYLQEQITTLQGQITNLDLSQTVDGVTIGYGTQAGGISSKLYLMDGSVTEEKLAFGIDEEDGLASYETVESLEKSVTLVSGDLAQVIFDLHLNDMAQLDLDTIAVFDFPDDVKEYQGQYDSGGNKYYAAPGTGA